MMQVQVNTDHSVEGSQEWAAEIGEGLRASLGHWADNLTRVEVHLSDVNARKGGAADKRCELEARVAGLPVLSVTDAAPTLMQAIHGATAKLRHALEHAIGKLEDARHGEGPSR